MDALVQGNEPVKQGKNPEALPIFQQAVRLNQYKEALDESDKALAIHPQYADAEPVVNRGLAIAPQDADD